MADFVLRSATQNELPEIRALIRTVHINPTGLDWRRFLLAVTPADVMIGCGQVKLHGDGSCELASIAVDRPHRGQGVARAIIERLVEEHSRPLYLMCRARLGLLYEKFGFRAAKLEEMTPYFQRISRLERFVNSKASKENRLLVMRLD